MCFREIQLGLKWGKDERFACGLQGQFHKRCWATGHKLTHRRLTLNTRKQFFPVKMGEHRWVRLPREAVSLHPWMIAPVRAAGSVWPCLVTQGPLPTSAFLWPSGSFPFFTDTTREQSLDRWLQVCPAGQERGQRWPSPLPAGAAAAFSGPCGATGPPLLRPPPPPAPPWAPGQPGAPLPPAQREPGGEQSLRAVPAGRPAASGRRRAPVLPPAFGIYGRRGRAVPPASLARRRRPARPAPAPRRRLTARPAGRRLRAGCGGPPRREQRRRQRGRAGHSGAQPSSAARSPPSAPRRPPPPPPRRRASCTAPKAGAARPRWAGRRRPAGAPCSGPRAGAASPPPSRRWRSTSLAWTPWRRRTEVRGRGTVAAGVRGHRGRSGPLQSRAGLGGDRPPGRAGGRCWTGGRGWWRVAWAEREIGSTVLVAGQRGVI